MVIDLDQVTFLGSAGLAVLAQTLDRCQRQGVELALRYSPAAARTLQLAGLAELFTILATNHPLR